MQMKPIKIELICDLKEISFHENIPFYKFGKTPYQLLFMKQIQMDYVSLLSDSVVIHENNSIVALRQFNYDNNMTNIQIYNMNLREKLFDKNFDLKVEFWKFLKDQIIIVSQTTVSYLDIQEQDSKHLFERSGQFQQGQTQIIGFDSDPQQNWFALKGISPGIEYNVEGHIQLYSKEKNISQYINGFACGFGKAKLHSDTYESSLIALSQNGTDQNQKKLNIIEIDQPPEGNFKWKCQITIYEQQINDFPLFMHIFQNLGLVMMITKSGFLQIYEISEQVRVFSEKITNGTIFAGIQNQEGDAFYDRFYQYQYQNNNLQIIYREIKFQIQYSSLL
ncbi:hypothetical protein pb186bvf_010840 [Paramecium bursaria]